MNRRGFFGMFAGVVASALAAAFVPWRKTVTVTRPARATIYRDMKLTDPWQEMHDIVTKNHVTSIRYVGTYYKDGTYKPND